MVSYVNLTICKVLCWCTNIKITRGPSQEIWRSVWPSFIPIGRYFSCRLAVFISSNHGLIHVTPLYRTSVQDLVRKGIPHHFRAIVWQLLCSAQNLPIKDQYSELLKMTSPCEKLIRRDIARTYPEHEFFKEKDSLGQEVLFNVMKVRPLQLFCFLMTVHGFQNFIAFVPAASCCHSWQQESVSIPKLAK